MTLFDVFISYGRADSQQFALWLQENLSALGYRVWLDKTDIPFAVNYQIHIDQSIEKVHNFVFLLSPHAVNSPYCNLEIDQALKFHKRIIPLMHVEKIAVDTWQQRHPQGTKEDWIAYQDKGLHSAIQNLHPGIDKINWINFQEGKNDFKQALQQLIETLEEQKSYVHQHTEYLVQALNWSQNQRQSSYLLKGARREAAEVWLKQAFKESPPFSQPTDLHCEFITESTKYADNRLAQVFLCYASEDTDLKESLRRQLDRDVFDSPPVDPSSLSVRVRQFLMRAGFSVWDRRYDLATGEQIKEAIAQGIEGSDNFIFLLSPESVQSSHCLEEFNYALSLNKRIIPVLISSIRQDAVPSSLKNIRLVDLRRVKNNLSEHAGGRKLIATLLQGRTYFQSHKLLLVQALKWERQRYNSSVLLRGSALRHYQSWLKPAQQRRHYQPTAVQEKFVLESLNQASKQTLDVFLIADLSDLDFARRLNNTLQLQGKSVWFEQASRLNAVDLQAAVQEALKSAQNCLFLLSSSSLQNSDCLADLANARQLHKRIIGVVDGELAEELPSPLVGCPIVNFQDQGADYSSNFGELYRILESDFKYVDFHTRLLVRALEWEDAGGDDDFLLRRKELRRAEDWLANSSGKVPAPSQQHLDYIAASRELPRRRIKLRSLGLGSAVTTLIVFGLRLLGMFQPLELAAYDTLMQQRPSESQDARMLIVVVDEAAGTWLREQVQQDRYQAGLGTIPDAALAETLAILSAHQPAAIGLDFYRDFEATPALAQRLQQTENLLGLCKATYQGVGVAQPPELSSAQVGFNDFLADDGIDFIRRHYLKQTAEPICDTDDAFSLRLAQTYLRHQGVDYTDPWTETGFRDMAVGAVRVPELWGGGLLGQNAAYHPALLGGYQTMLNYRVYRGDPNQFAPQISLKNILTRQFDPKLVQEKIILIGYKDVADRNADFYNTPYGEMPGLVLQGQMASQLISAALDQRPLIWWWPVWGETLWIGVWTGIGGLVMRQLIRPLGVGLGAIATTVTLVGVCYGVLVLTGGWLPLVPPLLGAAGAAGLVALLNRRIRNP